MPPLPDWTPLLRTPAFEVTAFLLGLVAGSFGNVCIHRLPAGRSVVSPPSRCPGCDALIRPWDNIPVLSWLALRGRCRACAAPISPRYPAVELLTGLLWLGLAVLGGPSLQTLVSMILVSALVVLSLIDLEHHLLPDAITLPGIALGLAASFLPGSSIGPLSAAAAAAGGWLAFAAVARAYERTRGIEGLGQGDWKMAAMLGAFLGWQKMLLTVLFASIAGTVVGLFLMALRGRDMRYALPFGTFLGVGAILVMFFGDPVLDWYKGLFHG
jgi:leader peptidase (prepilin peptidase)/N-methyltransferase